MIKIFKIILNFFVSFFKIIEENSQINIVRSIEKNLNGEVMVNVSGLNSNNKCKMYPDQILRNMSIKNQFRSVDIKILESIVITEGDIFIESKEYYNNVELYILKSILYNQTWSLTANEIKNNLEIYYRINKRFLRKELDIN